MSLFLPLRSNVAAWHSSHRGPNDHGILQIFLHLVSVAFLQPWRKRRNHRIGRLSPVNKDSRTKYGHHFHGFPNCKLMCLFSIAMSCTITMRLEGAPISALTHSAGASSISSHSETLLKALSKQHPC